MATGTWGIILTVAALVAIGFHIQRWRTRRISTLTLAAGLIARAGFVVLGLMYAVRFVDRYPRAPVYGLAIVGGGIVLNLLAGVVDNIRRSRQ